jgi:hypothetical protein
LTDSLLGICHLGPVDKEGEKVAFQGPHVLDYSNAAAAKTNKGSAFSISIRLILASSICLNHLGKGVLADQVKCPCHARHQNG